MKTVPKYSGQKQEKERDKKVKKKKKRKKNKKTSKQNNCVVMLKIKAEKVQIKLVKRWLYFTTKSGISTKALPIL